MRARRLLTTLLFLSVSLTATAEAGAATPSPAWEIQSIATPTNFLPGEERGGDRYQVFITNSGGTPTTGAPITIVDTLPEGIGVKSLELRSPRGGNPNISKGCAKPATDGGVTTVSCVVTEALQPSSKPATLDPGNQLLLEINVKVPPGAAGTLNNRVEVGGGGAASVSTEATNEAATEDAKAGFEEFHSQLTGADGLPVGQADARPYQYTTTFAVNTVKPKPGSSIPEAAQGNLREIEVALPPGLAANPTAVERCSSQQFAAISTAGGNFEVNECPDGSAVGLVIPQQLEGIAGTVPVPIYNLIPPRGMPAQLGFEVFGAPIYIDTRVRSDGDFGTTAYLENVTEAQRVTASRITIWGVPWDESHDSQRGRCGAIQEGSCPAEGEARPFLRLPSSCANPLAFGFHFETWRQPAASAGTEAGAAAPTGCAAPDFSPKIEARPTTNVADSPSGLRFSLHLPVRAHEEGPHPEEELGEADLRDVSVVLPAGLAVNPSSADGLDACTTTQIGLSTPTGQPAPIHFDEAPAACPDASKIGTVTASVPAIDHPISGSVFLASQEDNPFDSLLAIYIVLEDPQTGIVVKLAAKVSPNPLTGQLTTTVTEAPQVPVEDFEFEFFEGARAPLRTPASCGLYTTVAAMTPWTAPEGAVASPSDSFSITNGPAGLCPSGALAPKLTAGLGSSAAGAYSPFSLQLTRADATGEFSAISATTPLGLSARLAGIPYCPEAAIAQAAGRDHPGQGRLEQNQPSCPSASQVGTATAGAGAGPSPFYTSGKVYLAGPYKGAPLSLVTVVPAVAGPFDLGVVTDRIALQVNPESAQVTAVGDPLPTILSGIPLDVRDVRVDLDRPDFTLAPTSCDPSSVAATVTGTSGATATATNRFQVGGCQGLAFKPKLSLKLSGGTKRAGHPALRAVVTYPKGAGYANIAKAQVSLPHSEFLDQGNLNKVCTQPQLKSQSCPATSIYGKAKAWTPLLEKPLEGPVYLAVGFGYKLPALVAELDGQLRVILKGKIDTDKQKGIRSTFEAVPDAPIEKFELSMKGGAKYGLLENSEDICSTKQMAGAVFGAQNGKLLEQQVTIANSCKAKGGKGKKSGKGKGK